MKKSTAQAPVRKTEHEGTLDLEGLEVTIDPPHLRAVAYAFDYF